jgi:hypothetical protein
MPGVASGDLEAARLEIRKVKETAERMAKGDYPGEADQVRALAGLVHQLAEQTERLVDPMGAPIGSRFGDQSVDQHDTEVILEEDRSPERGPASPLGDRMGPVDDRTR